jgi:hypothetical protein
VFAPPEARLVRLNPPQMINANHRLLDRLSGRTDAVYLHQPDAVTERDPDWTASYRLPDPAGAAEAMLEALG